MRKPVGNFWIKPSIQIKITLQILFVIICTSFLTTLALVIAYKLKLRGGSFYYMSNDVMLDLKLTSIAGIILPSLLIAQVISILIGLGIGLYSSRKVAVPVYKFERWVKELSKGNLNTQLVFRQNEEMRELTMECNVMANDYRAAFMNLDSHLSRLESGKAQTDIVNEEIAALKAIVGKFDFK